MNSVKTAYLGAKAQEYDAIRFTTKNGKYMDRLEFDQLAEAISRTHVGSQVLEIGAGTGRFALRLARRGYKVTASDASTDMLEVIKSKDPGKLLILHHASGDSVGLNDSCFEFSYSIRVLNQLDSAATAFGLIRELFRVTRSGGRVLIEFVNQERPFKRKGAEVAFTFAELEKYLRDLGCTEVKRRGAFVLSMTAWERAPSIALPLMYSVEKVLGRFVPALASRGYLVATVSK